jgi:multiple sugar transport system substrate-binding protein
MIDDGAYFEGPWETTIVDGTSYGVPWYVETRLLYYRTDLAEAAGWTEPPADWDELKQMATDLKDGGAANGISLGLGVGSWQQFLPFAWSNGGEVIDESNAFTLDDPANVEALEYYASFFDEGLTSAQPEGFDITPAFIQGSFPMFFSGPWHLALINETGGEEFADKWAVAPMPAKESATSFVGGSNLVVFQESDNRDAAWAFVEFVSRPDIQSLWYQEVGALPPSRSPGRAVSWPTTSICRCSVSNCRTPRHPLRSPPGRRSPQRSMTRSNGLRSAAWTPRTPRQRCSPTRRGIGTGLAE